MAGKDEILKRRKLKPLDAQGWEGDGLFVRVLPARRLMELEEWASANKGDKVGPAARLVQAAIVSADGKEFFTLDDIGALEELDYDMLMSAYKMAASHNGMSEEAVEGQAKN